MRQEHTRRVIRQIVDLKMLRREGKSSQLSKVNPHHLFIPSTFLNSHNPPSY